MPDTVQDWARALVTTTINQAAWMSNPELRAWIAGCRLDLLTASMAGVSPAEAAKQAVVQRFFAAARPAVENLVRMLERDAVAA